MHPRIIRRKTDFLDKVPCALVKRFDLVAYVDTSVKSLVRDSCLSKHTVNATWGKPVPCTSYRALSTGGRFVVHRRGTNQTCSQLRSQARKPLSAWIHRTLTVGLPGERRQRLPKHHKRGAPAGYLLLLRLCLYPSERLAFEAGSPRALAVGGRHIGPLAQSKQRCCSASDF